MAKGAYVGVDNVARKIKKGYVGVDNTARKIKKAYIGIGGVARPCWSTGELEYYGPITSLSQGRCCLAATHVGNYALFGGGSNGTSFSASITRYSTIDTYDKSLTRSNPTSLSTSVTGLAATHVGDYALFGGGSSSSSNPGVTSLVNAYDKSLTRSNPTVLANSRYNIAATHVGNYALFGGGCNNIYTGSQYVLATVDAYNTSLTKSNPTGLSVAREGLAATHVGDYALFGGGYTRASRYYYSAVVDAYDKSLTRSNPTSLSTSVTALAATHVGDYALFGGGYEYVSTSKISNTAVVSAYDKSLTRSNPTSLSLARRNLVATHVGSYALFGGGSSDGINYYSTVDAYDKSLTRSNPTSLNVGRVNHAATYVGDYALFGGGMSYSSSTNTYTYEATVNAYTIG